MQTKITDPRAPVPETGKDVLIDCGLPLFGVALLSVAFWVVPIPVLLGLFVGYLGIILFVAVRKHTP